jgi:uncharacterized membrane protein SpoIIM required for sporulation
MIYSNSGRNENIMKKITLILAITIFSSLGWKLGDSFGIMTAYWLSFLGSLVGVVVGCFINRKFLEY